MLHLSLSILALSMGLSKASWIPNLESAFAKVAKRVDGQVTSAWLKHVQYILILIDLSSNIWTASTKATWQCENRNVK